MYIPDIQEKGYSLNLSYTLPLTGGHKYNQFSLLKYFFLVCYRMAQELHCYTYYNIQICDDLHDMYVQSVYDIITC